jgi:drug/metabolite transporter (DMT)-like permease
MAGAALCWSLSGIIVRNLSLANNWEIAFWRSLFSAVFLALLLGHWHGRDAWRQVRGTGRAGIASGLMWAVMMTCFILAITLTSVANTQVVMSLAPFTGAILARLVLKEHVRLRTWLAILFAALGVAAMFGDALSPSAMAGNAIALAVPLAYALNVVIVRSAGKRIDMVPSILLGSLFALMATAPLAWPFAVSLRDLFLLALMAAVQLALGCVLFIRAARYLQVAELGLIGLLETLLAPLWVWLGVGERPSPLALFGGAIVIASLACNELLNLAGARTPHAARIRS